MNYEHTESEKISDIKFSPISVGDHACNANRKEENLYLLSSFSDVVPKYNSEYGPHLELTSKKSPEPIIVPLNNTVTSGMLIENYQKMTDDEYYNTFVEKKKEFIEKYLIKNTFAKGFENPSAVQALAIPELIQRRDALIQFKSGTGKTHAFLFGCLWGFDPQDNALQYVFVTSSHEVAVQIYDQAKFLLPSTTQIALCIGQKKDVGSTSTGGFKTPISTSSLNNRTKTLKEEKEEINRAQVIVCTMGKFYDYLCNRKFINCIKYLKTICVDEFDNIVASRSRARTSTVMSTEDQMAAIMKEIPQTAQRVFFSATVSQQALEIAYSYFRQYNPSVGESFIVLLNIEDYTLEGIRQYYVQCNSFTEKQDVLIDLLGQCRIAQGIIFTNRIDTANEIQSYLEKQKPPIKSSVFHADLPAQLRKSVHKEFTENKTRLLISTDVSARGLDVQGINVVINFDMPDALETYIHRVGRSGRYGKKGVAISLILVNSLKNEMKKVDGINEHSENNKMKALPQDLSDLL